MIDISETWDAEKNAYVWQYHEPYNEAEYYLEIHRTEEIMKEAAI